MKKKALTLIEVMVALSLLSIILFTLLYQYKNLVRSQVKMDQKLELAMQKHKGALRLHEVFLNLTLEDEDALAIVAPNILQLIWDNGVHINPKLSGVIKGKLQSKNNELILEYENGEFEVILQAVNAVKFLFFDAKEKMWATDSAQFIPSMVRLKLMPKDKKEWDLSFFIHHEDSSIHYGETP